MFNCPKCLRRYFQDALVNGADLRLPDPGGNNKQPNGASNCTPTPAPRANATLEVRVGGGPTRHTPPTGRQQAPVAPGHAQPHRGHAQQQQQHNGNHSPPQTTVTNLPPYKLGGGGGGGQQNGPNSQHLHLPESPPDSGSEPPFSPPHDDKLSGALAQQLSPDMMHQSGPHGHDGQLKHFVPYMPPGQHIKHLPHPSDLSLNINQPLIHPALHSVSRRRNHLALLRC